MLFKLYIFCSLFFVRCVCVLQVYLYLPFPSSSWELFIELGESAFLVGQHCLRARLIKSPIDTDGPELRFVGEAEMEVIDLDGGLRIVEVKIK